MFGLINSYLWTLTFVKACSIFCRLFSLFTWLQSISVFSKKTSSHLFPFLFLVNFRSLKDTYPKFYVIKINTATIYPPLISRIIWLLFKVSMRAENGNVRISFKTFPSLISRIFFECFFRFLWAQKRKSTYRS